MLVASGKSLPGGGAGLHGPHVPDYLACFEFRCRGRSSLMSQSQRKMLQFLLLSAAMAALFAPVPRAGWADARMPALFADHMVLQRDHANPVWGWADAGEEVVVVLGEQTKKTTADADGKWRVVLDPLPAGGPHKMVIEGKNRVAIEDILVGEVWVCSGQSNMAWNVDNTYAADLTRLTAQYPRLRMITVPLIGTQEMKDDFKGEWQLCSPDTVGNFSAVGFFFGRVLHQALDIPIGVIHDSWGGSACEAWVPRPLLEADPQYKPLIDGWVKIEEDGTDEQQLKGNARPGNLYNGMLNPVVGYGIRGAIWYQGETNAGRAYQYRQMFPLMIKSWRDAWKQGDFSFYWVQLADFKQENTEPMDSAWAELREAQTMTLSLPNTGQAVIIDIGEANDIHPRNKEDVGERLARWAGQGLPHRHRLPQPRVQIDAARRQQNRAHIRLRRRWSQAVRCQRNQRFHDRRRGQEVRQCPGHARRQDEGSDRRLERCRQRTGRGPLRVGQQSDLQS